MFDLFFWYTNNDPLVSDTCRANGNQRKQCCADVIEDNLTTH